MNKPKRVVCAAIRKNKTIICGVRHFDNIMRDVQFSIYDEFYLTWNAEQISENCYRTWEQGFVDNHMNFLTRKEAWDVAVLAKQVESTTYPDEELTSEDLY